MSIKVEHGGQSGPAAGQVIGQGMQAAANRQLQEKMLAAKMLSDIANRTQGGGRGGGSGGGGGGRKGGTDDELTRIGFQNDLAKRAKEQDFANEMAAKQEEARLDTRKWKYEFTAKDKQQIAKYNQGRQAINAALENGEIDQSTADAMRLKVDMAQSGMETSMVPDEGAWTGDPERAPGSGMTWLDKDGNTMTTEEDGTPKLIQQYKQGREYHLNQIKAEGAIAEAAEKQAIEKEALDRRHEAETDYRKFLQDYEQQGEPITDEKGTYTLSEKLSLDEIEAKMAIWQQNNPTPEQQRQIEQVIMQRQQAEAQQFSPEIEAQVEAAVAELEPGEQLQLPDGTFFRKHAEPFRSWRERDLPMRGFGGTK